MRETCSLDYRGDGAHRMTLQLLNMTNSLRAGRSELRAGAYTVFVTLAYWMDAQR